MDWCTMYIQVSAFLQHVNHEKYQLPTCTIRGDSLVVITITSMVVEGRFDASVSRTRARQMTTKTILYKEQISLFISFARWIIELLQRKNTTKIK